MLWLESWLLQFLLNTVYKKHFLISQIFCLGLRSSPLWTTVSPLQDGTPNFFHGVLGLPNCSRCSSSPTWWTLSRTNCSWTIALEMFIFLWRAGNLYKKVFNNIAILSTKIAVNSVKSRRLQKGLPRHNVENLQKWNVMNIRGSLMISHIFGKNMARC